MPSLRHALEASRGPTAAPVWTCAKEVRSTRAVGAAAAERRHAPSTRTPSTRRRKTSSGNPPLTFKRGKGRGAKIHAGRGDRDLLPEMRSPSFSPKRLRISSEQAWHSVMKW